MEHTAKLQLYTIIEVQVEAGLNQSLFNTGSIHVEAIGVFQFTVQVEAHGLTGQFCRSADFSGQHALVPAASGVRQGAGVLFDVGTGFFNTR